MTVPALKVLSAHDAPSAPATGAKPALVEAAAVAATTYDAPLESDALLGTYKRAPVEFTGGEGVYLVDSAGNRYLDFVSGIAVNALGYGDAGLTAALHRASDQLVHTSNLYWTAPGRELAASLVSKSFADRVFFCNSGAEANEGAFKFARRWGRTVGEAKHEIIGLRGGFHGRLFATLAATDRPAYRLPFRPLAPGISVFERDIEDLSTALDAETVCAVILEPVQGEGGVRVLDAGFVCELRALTAERGIALIFDEIQCGLGRTGTLWAHEQFGVTPDMMTLAKPIAGGLPMGAILLTEEIAQTIKPGDHGTTFGGGPFVASVAQHVFGRLSDPALLAQVTENGAWFGEQLRELASRTGRIRQVRGMGYMWGLDIMGTAGHVVSEALANGLLTCTAGEYTLRLLPPLVATRDELARGIAILEEVL
ncbi:MAG: Acetylornithine/succinyldiaminopimelate aminotransferase [Gemmatimonadetes bacterium]|nr:Acetylornithine/succinyldiaminopimelate aminotransferase [Gemmatimonadota bacterium]